MLFVIDWVWAEQEFFMHKAHYTKNIAYIFYSTDFSFNTNSIHKQSISRFPPQPHTFAFYNLPDMNF